MEGDEEVGVGVPTLAEKRRRGSQTWLLRDGAGDGEMILNSEDFGEIVWRFGEKVLSLHTTGEKMQEVMSLRAYAR